MRRRLGCARRVIGGPGSCRAAAARQHSGLPVPEPGDFRRNRGVGGTLRRSRRPRRVRELDRRTARRGALAATALRAGGISGPGSARIQASPAERRARRHLVPERDARRGPAAPARRLGAFANHGGIGSRAGRLPARARRLLRHAGAQRARRFPQADGGRDATPDDGRLPFHARQPETRRSAQHPPRRELCARVPAAVHRRPRATQPRRHAAAGRRRPAAAPRSTRRSSRASPNVFTGWKWACAEDSPSGCDFDRTRPTPAEPGASDAGVRRAAFEGRETAARLPRRAASIPACRSGGRAGSR